LDTFLSSPDARYYIRELERKIKEEAKNVSRELKNLETLGLLMSEQQGNQKYYSVNKDFLLYPELKAVIFKTMGVQGPLKEAMNKLNRVEVAFIYGSYASGKESETSDIDVMIIGNPDMTELIEIISELEQKLNREINYMCFDREEFKKRKRSEEAFISEVLSGEKIMLKGSEDDIGRI
jgi:predicted nucleotidyltransferase